jgi:nicotinamidase-related amidase
MSNKRKTYLLSIDPQRDFCEKPGNGAGALFVTGADADMKRLAGFLNKRGNSIDEIFVSLDSHQMFHIAHPPFWVDSKGNHPAPFTMITAADVKSGKWTPFNPNFRKHAEMYTETLEKNARYVLVIWPPHCLIGTEGAAIVPEVSKALYDWEIANQNRINFVAKGSNLLTEHYSAVQADVPDDNDPNTKLNTSIIDMLRDADEILITGEALSHCVANTINDIANNFGDDNIKKFTLLSDTSSNVTNFEKMGEDFVKTMTKRGMKVTTTKDW